ncbi:MAG TPA: hypothetical protein VGX28_15060 [Frankiaceae bacterium]|nr:hypothetical protein [Frankiaceae bacterium]
MRRLLLIPAAAVALSCAPAANAYLYNGCQPGDWTVADVVVAGREVAQVCASENPLVFIRCIDLVTCR